MTGIKEHPNIPIGLKILAPGADMFSRLILFILAILFNVAAYSGVSAVAPNPEILWKPQWGGSVGFNSVAAVCAYDIGLPSWSAASPGCSFSCTDIIQNATSGSYTVHAVCSGGSTANTNRISNKSATCPSGYTVSQDQTTCIPAPDGDCASKKGQNVNAFVGPVADPSSISPYIDVCQGTCGASLVNAAPKVSKTNGQVYMVGTWSYTGESCNSGDPVASTTDPDVSDNPEPDGDDTITKSCSNNPGGGHTTTYTITHPDGSKDFQYITLAGACSGANDDPDAEKDFCRENPTASACKDFCADNPAACVDRNSDGGLFCAAPPVCTGDEIDCAALFQQWTTRCAFETDAFTLPEAPPKTPQELAELENKKVTDLLDNGAAVTAYNDFKLMNWSTWIPVFPAASCSPFTGTVAGNSVSIDVCPKIAMLNELIGWLFAVYGAWTVVSMVYRKE